ncbi:hypothetical protein [Streptomyces brevispora]|uniref:Uncharacterized protein n=1 Tax=Streptomyces brevispora TaxID=887462 RepID=A0ABZ1G9B6_9ACTN|nr:hypothetical protein [Streptomyces brevispora]WSC15856.1 hypothetical protein OIE64_25490 [Streptomyces brevispora]
MTRETGRRPVPNRSALSSTPPTTCPAAAPVAGTAAQAPSLRHGWPKYGLAAEMSATNVSRAGSPV